MYYIARYSLGMRQHRKQFIDISGEQTVLGHNLEKVCKLQRAHVGTYHHVTD